MTPLDWEFVQSQYRDEFGREMKGHRWWKKFKHVDRDVLVAAFQLHGEDSNTAPTVKQVIDCLPKGLVRRGKPDHYHAWDHLPLPEGMPGELVWCNTCGGHDKARCGCERCICPHLSAKRISRLWYWCPDCDGCIRAREDDPDVPF